MELRVLSGAEVAQLLPMERAIELMRQALADYSAGRTVTPLRSRIDTADGDLLLMPSCLPGAGLCLKAVLTYPGNRQLGLPVVQGLALVFDERTGAPRAVMDCEELTAIRTAAVCGLAIDVLAPPESRSAAVLGAGVQARRQVEAALAVRPVEELRVFDVRREAAESLVAELARSRADVRAVAASDARSAVEEADLVITATTSATPVLAADWLKPGAHVNAIGAYRPDRRELDADTVWRARVVVESRESAAAEAGDLKLAGRAPDAELGEILNGTASGRTDPRQLTVFKTVGLAVQDAAAAGWVAREAQRRGVGHIVRI